MLLIKLKQKSNADATPSTLRDARPATGTAPPYFTALHVRNAYSHTIFSGFEVVEVSSHAAVVEFTAAGAIEVVSFDSGQTETLVHGVITVGGSDAG